MVQNSQSTSNCSASNRLDGLEQGKYYERKKEEKKKLFYFSGFFFLFTTINEIIRNVTKSDKKLEIELF